MYIKGKKIFNVSGIYNTNFYKLSTPFTTNLNFKGIYLDKEGFRLNRKSDVLLDYFTGISPLIVYNYSEYLSDKYSVKFETIYPILNLNVATFTDVLQTTVRLNENINLIAGFELNNINNTHKYETQLNIAINTWIGYIRYPACSWRFKGSWLNYASLTGGRWSCQ